MTPLTGSARVAGVVGWPISHSRSPQLHGYWLKKHCVDGAYVPLAVAPDDLERAVTGLSALGFAGVNVTVPHKESVMPLLGSLDEEARRVGAVNTIVVIDGGRLVGSNTDGYGFFENLKAGIPQWTAEQGPAVILGAGGVARAIAFALSDAGVSDLRIVNRTAERGRLLAEASGARAYAWAEHAHALEGAALLVNATVLGMAGQRPLDLGLDALPRDAVVNDVVYTPLETPLLTAARARGNAVVDGLGMLLHQGRPAFRAWFGIDPEVDDALRTHVLGA